MSGKLVKFVTNSGCEKLSPPFPALRTWRKSIGDENEWPNLSSLIWNIEFATKI